jgi:hypothetical protein
MEPGDLVRVKQRFLPGSALNLAEGGTGIIIDYGCTPAEGDRDESIRIPYMLNYFQVLMPLDDGGSRVMSFYMNEIERVK